VPGNDTQNQGTSSVGQPPRGGHEKKGQEGEIKKEASKIMEKGPGTVLGSTRSRRGSGRGETRKGRVPFRGIPI